MLACKRTKKDASNAQKFPGWVHKELKSKMQVCECRGSGVRRQERGFAARPPALILRNNGITDILPVLTHRSSHFTWFQLKCSCFLVKPQSHLHTGRSACRGLGLCTTARSTQCPGPMSRLVGAEGAACPRHSLLTPVSGGDTVQGSAPRVCITVSV